MPEVPKPEAEKNNNIRLHVNINKETASILEFWSAYRDKTVTETVRQAVGLLGIIYSADAENRVTGTINEDGSKRLIIDFIEADEFPFEVKE